MSFRMLAQHIESRLQQIQPTVGDFHSAIRFVRFIPQKLLFNAALRFR